MVRGKIFTQRRSIRVYLDYEPRPPPILHTLQVVQSILTNATISKDSDTMYYNGGLWDFFFIFRANLRNQEIVNQNNIAKNIIK